MSVGKAGGGAGGFEPIRLGQEPIEERGEEPELEAVKGPADEAFLREQLERYFGRGPIGRAGGAVKDFLADVGVIRAPSRREREGARVEIGELPAFEIHAKGGGRVYVDLAEVEDLTFENDPHPGVELTYAPPKGPKVSFDLAAANGRTLFTGVELEAPLSLRHIHVARKTLDTIAGFVRAAGRPGVTLGEGATKREIRAAAKVVAKIDRELSKLETAAKLSPEAHLAALVYARLADGRLREKPGFEQAIADLDAALERVARDPSLNARERRVVDANVRAVRDLVRHERKP